MFEEAQLYAPVTRTGDDVTVHLGDNHPGAVDPEYRFAVTLRRAQDWQPGNATPTRDLHRRGNRFWRSSAESFTTCTSGLGLRRAPEGKERLGFLRSIPQLVEVNDMLHHDRFPARAGRRSGSTLEFYGSLWMDFPLHAIHSAPFRAALHTRTRRHPRGPRARQLPGT
jgi:hypothetical protein